MISKRRFLLCACGAVCATASLPARAALPPISMARHERAMRQAIEEARRNSVYPFGAVIVRGDTGEVMARSVNNSRENPILHGEIACMNDYVRLNGNKGWGQAVLYTTGEPCSMCMSALVWAGIGGVVFASSIDGIRRSGIEQIDIAAGGRGCGVAVLQRAAAGRRACHGDRPDVHGSAQRLTAWRRLRGVS